MTLRYLSEFADVAALLDDARRRTPVFYETRVAPSPDGMVAMWAGDAGYESGEADTAGARHRLYIGPGPWTLERRPD
jgi:hypothetical protein